MNRKLLASAAVLAIGALLGFVVIQAQAPTGDRAEPYLKYKFMVEIDGIVNAYFLEVEGLNVTVDVIEYREGADQLGPILIPGLAHYGPLVLRDGVTENTELLNWMKNTTTGTVERKNLSVIILTPEGYEVARYNVLRAWPSGWSLGKLDSLGVGQVIEELVIQYEGLSRGG